MSLDPFAITIIFLALGAGAFVKGMAGNGLPLVAVPIMALFIDLPHAVIVIQIPNLASNIWLLWENRKQLKNAPIRLDMVVPSTITVVIGVWFLSSVDQLITTTLLGLILGAFLLLLFFKPGFRLTGTINRIVTPFASIIGGFIQGSTGVSGPIYAPLLYSLRLSKEGFLFYNGLLYGFFNSIQVAAMLWLGMFSAEYFFQGILALLPMFIFQYLGILMRQRLSLLSFNRVVIAILGVIELKLVWDIMVDWNLI